MRADLSFSITRTYSQRSSWLWQVQAIVPYQYKWQPAVRQVILIAFKNSTLVKLLESNKEWSRVVFFLRLTLPTFLLAYTLASV